MNIVEKNINAISELCKKHKVRKLYAFGSVLTDRFTEESDVDMVVEFMRVPLKIYADNYYHLKYSLQDIFNRKVDLLESQTSTNPYLKRSIDGTKQLIYERRY
jgi:predicted nucleotidyltransferase